MARGFISANSARVFAFFFCCATREKGNYVEILLPAVTAEGKGGVAIEADRARTTRRKLSGKHDERNEGEHEQRESKGVGGGRGAVPLKETQYALLRVTFIFLALSQVQKRRRRKEKVKESYRKLTLLRMLSTVALCTPPRSRVTPMGHCS